MFEIYTALSYVRVASYTSHTLPCLNTKQFAVKVISKDQQPLNQSRIKREKKMSKEIDLYANNFGETYANLLPNLGQAMVDVLRFFECQRIYGVGGDYAANLIAAFEKEFDICPSSNEMHAAFTACGQAEVEGLGVCLTTYTVGSLPCVSAAALAVTEKLPVIFISGAPGESEITNMALHHTVSSCSTWKAEYDAALESFRALGIKAERLQGQRNSAQPNVAASCPARARIRRRYG